MSDWKTTTLGEFIALQRGHDLPYHSRRPGQIPVVGSGGITGFHDTAVVVGPGITIGRAANIGVPTLIQEDFWPLNTTLYVTDFYGNDVKFSYYLLRTLDLAGFDSGSVQPMLNRNYIRDFRIRVPDVREQEIIAALLGAIDDKIAVNGRMTLTSAELLRARFQSCMQKSGRTLKISQLISLKYGRALKEEDRSPGIVPVFGGNGISGWHDTSLCDRPGIIVGRKGANAGSVSWSQVPFWAIDTAFYVDTIPGGQPLEFIFFLLQSAGLRSLVGDSAIPGLNRETALSCRVQLPEDGQIARFVDLARPVLSLSWQASEESKILGELRDTLLPRLMSGQIRVKDAEKIVEDVT